jgi:hypothetical protein
MPYSENCGLPVTQTANVLQKLWSQLKNLKYTEMQLSRCPNNNPSLSIAPTAVVEPSKPQTLTQWALTERIFNFIIVYKQKAMLNSPTTRKITV